MGGGIPCVQPLKKEAWVQRRKGLARTSHATPRSERQRGKNSRLPGRFDRIDVDGFLIGVGGCLHCHVVTVELFHSVGIVDCPDLLLRFVDKDRGHPARAEKPQSPSRSIPTGCCSRAPDMRRFCGCRRATPQMTHATRQNFNRSPNSSLIVAPNGWTTNPGKSRHRSTK